MAKLNIKPVFDLIGGTTPDSEIVNIKPTQEIRAIQNPVHIFSQMGTISERISRRKNIFEPSEYDLYEISRIEDVESLVRQANSKKIGLFLKEGFDILSKQKKYVKYLRIRFNQIAHASNIPFHELIRRTASQFIKKSNAFLVKVRKEESSGGKVRIETLTGKSLNPIAGYFPAAPETMEVETDGSGRPVRWRQHLPNGIERFFKPEDVIHFTFDRKEGFLFGTPTIVPVIEDILTLRQIEQNIELLIYKHLFPLFQYKVGTEKMPAGMTEDGRREVDVVRTTVEQLPSEGAIVTPERHEITAIGAENQALRAEEYVNYFRDRVIAGLGMSSVDYGDAKTSNRSTSETLSKALVDSVKDMQDSFEAQFNQFVVKELMLESTFGEEVLLEENKVRIKFKEIDIDKQIKVEKHAMELFAGHAITWDETRLTMGRDPILTPDDPHETDPTKFPEWHNTFWKLFEEPKALIASTDEPWGPAAQALAESKSSAVTQPQLAAGTAQVEKLEKIKKVAKKPAKKDSYLDQDYDDVASLIIDRLPTLQSKADFDLFQISGVRTVVDHMINNLISSMSTGFHRELYVPVTPNNLYLFTFGRRLIQSRATLLINKLFKDVNTQIKNRINNSMFIDGNLPSDIIANIRILFDSLRYRLNFITETEYRKSLNMGKLTNFRLNNITEVTIDSNNAECNKCKSQNGAKVSIEIMRDFDTILPSHASCNCTYKV